MIDASDIAFTILMFLLIAGIIHGIVVNKRARIENMDDEDPFDEEWKGGDPNAPLPEDAKPVDLKYDPLKPDDQPCMPIRSKKPDAED